MDESFKHDELSEYEQKALMLFTKACVTIQSWFKMLVQRSKYRAALKKKEINDKLELERALSAMDREL